MAGTWIDFAALIPTVLGAAVLASAAFLSKTGGRSAVGRRACNRSVGVVLYPGCFLVFAGAVLSGQRFLLNLDAAADSGEWLAYWYLYISLFIVSSSTTLLFISIGTNAALYELDQFSLAVRWQDDAERGRFIEMVRNQLRSRFWSHIPAGAIALFATRTHLGHALKLDASPAWTFVWVPLWFVGGWITGVALYRLFVGMRWVGYLSSRQPVGPSSVCSTVKIGEATAIGAFAAATVLTMFVIAAVVETKSVAVYSLMNQRQSFPIAMSYMQDNDLKKSKLLQVSGSQVQEARVGAAVSVAARDPLRLVSACIYVFIVSVFFLIQWQLRGFLLSARDSIESQSKQVLSRVSAPDVINQHFVLMRSIPNWPVSWPRMFALGATIGGYIVLIMKALRL